MSAESSLFQTDLARLIEMLVSAQGLWQGAALLAAVALAWFLERALRPNLPGSNATAGLRKLGAGSAGRLLHPLLLLLCSAIAYLVLSRFQPVPILRIALPLITSFVVIRFSLYLLRHLIAPSALLKASERLIAYAVWGIVALHLIGVLPELVATLEEFSFALGSRKISLLMVVTAVFAGTVTMIVALSLSSLIERRVMGTDTIDMGSRVVITKVVRALSLVLAVLIALPLVGIDLTLLSVFGGAFGVGLGLGLQKIASNYASGFIILLDRSIRLGDLVTVDNRHGVVKTIKSRYTVVRAADGTESIIPNDTLITHTVVNHSRADQLAQIRVPVSVAYDTDLEVAKRILLEVARSQPRVVAAPAAEALVVALAESGVDLELAVWVADSTNGLARLRSSLLQGICEQFREACVGIASPQRALSIVGRSDRRRPPDPSAQKPVPT